MATVETTATTPATGRGWSPARIAAIVAAVVGLAAIIILAVMLHGQSAQIAALQGQVSGANRAAAAAQAQAGQAVSAAQQAGKTQAAATDANLGVCVSTQYNAGGGVTYVQSVDVTSPVKSAGGAVSCPSGTFTPVSPQPAGH